MLVTFDRSVMHRFEYRGPRYSVDLPVELTTPDATLAARCTEISKEGLKLELAEAVPCGSVGIVFVCYQGRPMRFRVRSIHTGGRYCGWEFLYNSDAEQDAVAGLVDAIAVPNTRRRPMLIKSS
jgi:PilZ domain